MPIDPMLEAAILNRLQEKKRGQTIEELSEHLKRTQSELLTVLHSLGLGKSVKLENGSWKLAHDD